jgi:hypothetical protein
MQFRPDYEGTGHYEGTGEHCIDLTDTRTSSDNVTKKNTISRRLQHRPGSREEEESDTGAAQAQERLGQGP